MSFSGLPNGGIPPTPPPSDLPEDEKWSVMANGKVVLVILFSARCLKQKTTMHYVCEGINLNIIQEHELNFDLCRTDNLYF